MCSLAEAEEPGRSRDRALLTFSNGALGVIQASTAVYPGFPERLEITGSNGTAIVEALGPLGNGIHDRAQPRVGDRGDTAGVKRRDHAASCNREAVRVVALDLTSARPRLKYTTPVLSFTCNPRVHGRVRAIRLSAFGGEIADDLDAQIASLRRHDVGFLERRAAWRTNAIDLSDGDLERGCGRLTANLVGVSAVASPVGKVPIDGDLTSSAASRTKTVRDTSARRWPRCEASCLKEKSAEREPYAMGSSTHADDA